MYSRNKTEQLLIKENGSYSTEDDYIMHALALLQPYIWVKSYKKWSTQKQKLNRK